MHVPIYLKDYSYDVPAEEKEGGDSVETVTRLCLSLADITCCSLSEHTHKQLYLLLCSKTSRSEELL